MDPFGAPAAAAAPRAGRRAAGTTPSPSAGMGTMQTSSSLGVGGGSFAQTVTSPAVTPSHAASPAAAHQPPAATPSGQPDLAAWLDEPAVPSVTPTFSAAASPRAQAPAQQIASPFAANPTPSTTPVVQPAPQNQEAELEAALRATESSLATTQAATQSAEATLTALQGDMARELQEKRTRLEEARRKHQDAMDAARAKVAAKREELLAQMRDLPAKAAAEAEQAARDTYTKAIATATEHVHEATTRLQNQEALADLGSQVISDTVKDVVAAAVETVTNAVRASRDNMGNRVGAIAEEQVAAAAKRLNEERATRIHEEREARHEALTEHRAARDSAFNDFRKQRSRMRDTAYEALGNRLKEFRNNFVDRVADRTNKTASERKQFANAEREKLQDESTATLTRVMHRHRTMIQEERAVADSQIKEMGERLKAELTFRRKGFSNDIVSLRRQLQREVESFAATALDTAPRRMSDVLDPLRSLSARFQHLSDKVEIGYQQSRRLKEADPGRTAHLVQEREAVVSQLRAHIASDKNALEREWLRMSSLLCDYDARVESMSKASSATHAQVNAAHQKVDATRSAWEKAHRDMLTEASSVTVTSVDEAQNSVLLDLSTQLAKLTATSSTLTQQRRTQWQRQVQLTDEVEQRRAESERVRMNILTKYDELSQNVAALKLKQRDIDRETEEYMAEKGALDAEVRGFQQDSERMQALSDALQRESAAVAEQHRQCVQQLMEAQAAQERLEEKRRRVQSKDRALVVQQQDLLQHQRRTQMYSDRLQRSALDYNTVVGARRHHQSGDGGYSPQQHHHSPPQQHGVSFSYPLQQPIVSSGSEPSNAGDFSALVPLSSLEGGTTSHSITTPSAFTESPPTSS